MSAGASFSKEQSASISGTVEPGKVLTTRLGNLPKGAHVSIRVDASGDISELLIDQHDFEAFPKLKKPLFTGHTSDRLSFALRVPKSGNYFLIIDNRDGAEAREFTLAVTASADVSEASGKVAKAYREFDKFEENLRQYFIFDDVKFRFARCGTGSAFSGENTVVLCTELGSRLQQTMGDKQKSRDVLFFIMLHEFGHVLLKQWGYPFHDNEGVVDEFTTVFLVMFGQSERARTQAEFFSRLPPDLEFEQKRDRDDRHPLSVQRARNIHRWLDNPDLVRRWQKILVPQMQTALLEALHRRPKSWSDRELVEKELARRSP